MCCLSLKKGLWCIVAEEGAVTMFTQVSLAVFWYVTAIYRDPASHCLDVCQSTSETHFSVCKWGWSTCYFHCFVPNLFLASVKIWCVWAVVYSTWIRDGMAISLPNSAWQESWENSQTKYDLGAGMEALEASVQQSNKNCHPSTTLQTSKSKKLTMRMKCSKAQHIFLYILDLKLWRATGSIEDR